MQESILPDFKKCKLLHTGFYCISSKEIPQWNIAGFHSHAIKKNYGNQDLDLCG